jgi:hypothetical protein
MSQDVAGTYARMMQVWKVKNYRELGAKLEGKPAGTIASRKYQRSVPTEYILLTMLGTGCRKEWLLTGEGDVYRGELLVADLTAPLQAAVRSLMGASDAVQTLFERVAGLLATNQPAVMDAIKGGVIVANVRKKTPADIKADVPDPLPGAPLN